MKDLLIFDMDGVLVDVSESYRETICATVRDFTGREITLEQIQEIKAEGGWNDDWRLSHHLIREAGVDASFEEVVERFQKFFHGTNGTEGLILRERWLIEMPVLERLARRFDLAIFTGRPRAEADLTLNRFCPSPTFGCIIGMYDVERHKPDPEGLFKIRELFPRDRAWYIGDTVDDARAARDAGVPFIGIATAPHREQMARLLEAEGATAVLDSVNQLESVLP